jgi:hypothetical protein
MLSGIASFSTYHDYKDKVICTYNIDFLLIIIVKKIPQFQLFL